MNVAKKRQEILEGSSKTEFYDLSERLLNSGDAYWGNLGFWKNEKEYSKACEALAHQLALKVDLSESSRVLDVGFGCGDQLFLWLENYQIECLCGVNYSISQTQLAKQRLADYGSTSANSQSLVQGSVEELLEPSSWESSILSQESVNTILALDCAYHFPSRKRFFIDSFNVISQSRENGCIGLTDIILADAALSSGKSLILNSMLYLSRIPQENIVTQDEYIDQLQQAGFVQIENQDISEYVFEPFGHWFNSSKVVRGKLKGNFGAWLKYKVTAAFLAWAYRKQVLRYVVITARIL